jgi:hypothetical protein
MRTLTLVAIFTLSLVCQGSQAEDEWLSYEPASVELKGTLRITEEFGPPNFGENPESDLKLEIPVLDLASPINVRADPNSDINDKSFKGVKRLQLVFPIGARNSKELVGRQVVVVGSLLQAHTAHHYTKVLFTVDEIRLADRQPVPR